METALKHWLRAYSLAWLPLSVAYFFVLGLFIGVSGYDLVSSWIANLLPAFVMGIAVFHGTIRFLTGLSIKSQTAIHAFAAVVFSLIWAQALFRLLQVSAGLAHGDWSFQGFAGRALPWQLLQGLLIYFVITSATYAYWALSKLSDQSKSPNDSADTRLFVKTDDTYVAIDADEVIACASENGGTIIITQEHAYKTRKSLAELADQLKAQSLFRVHRSWLVNKAHIASVEPAGNGRLTLRLTNKHRVDTSRKGAQLIRDALGLVN